MPGQRVSEARRWFQQAHYDLKGASWNIEGGFFNTACVLAQQSAEKALKSLLYYHGSRRAALLTHSLLEMVREVGTQVPAVGGLVEEARALDIHYVPSRSPNGLPSGYPHQFYGKVTAEQAVRAAEAIVASVGEHYRSRGDQAILAEDA